ncbi:MAG: thermonuclease family protein [Patescibacteria group bacterium]
MTRTNKQLTIYVLAIILAVIQILFVKDIPLLKTSLVPTNIPTPTTFIGEKQTILVTRVIDGDTIEIEGNIKVRYVGINSPESEQCFSNEAYLENKKLVEGKTVTLIKDVSDKDKYGRLLRYVYLNDLFVNDYLIKNGFAKIMMIKPDIKYYQEFKIGEKEAKEKKFGIWDKCN